MANGAAARSSANLDETDGMDDLDVAPDVAMAAAQRRSYAAWPAWRRSAVARELQLVGAGLLT
jgi:hypothetical protein